MSDKQNISAEVGNSAADQLHSSPQEKTPQEESLHAAGTGVCFPRHVEDIAAEFENFPYPQNQSPFMTFTGKKSTSDVITEANKSINKETSDSSDLGKTSHLSQDKPPQVSDSSIVSLKNEENAISGNGNPLSLQGQPSRMQTNSESLSEDTTSADVVFDKKFVHQCTSTKDIVIKDFPLNTSRSGKLFENKHLSNEETKYTPWTIENLFGSQNQNIMSRSDECKNTEIGTPADKCKEVIQNKDLIIKGEELHFTNDPSLNDISLEYLKLYSESPPENYDFAMNIMAYIEFLNDFSWKATVSYFDEKIKRIVKYIWNASKSDSKCNILMQKYRRKLFLDMLVHFTESCLSGGYDLVEFLKYCVEMCQLGVIARKHNFKEAPLRVIGFLRSSIGRLELKGYLTDTFENIVKEYAQKLYTQNMFPFMIDAENQIINNNNGTFSRAPGGSQDSNQSRCLPQVPKFSETESSEFPSSELIGDMALRAEQWFYNQSPLMSHFNSFPFFGTAFNTEGLYNSKVFFEFGSVNDINSKNVTSNGQTKNELGVNKSPLNGQSEDQKPIEHLFSGQSEALQMDDYGFLQSERKVLGTETDFLINERQKDLNIACGSRLDEHITDITSEHLAPNQGINPKDMSFTDNQSAKDISPEYIQLYSKKHPNNQDFAMNIMAYIELLNDCSWNATFSYFDENVKKMFSRIWNESKDLFNGYAVEFNDLHQMKFLDIMVESTELYLSVTKYDLNDFLYYCVQMCQIGVVARKNHLKEAPLIVMDFLRNSIRRLASKYSFSDTFENIVKEHAQKLIEC
ncbi:hypothetical protein HNY73_009135 [Argiope bruennichi]|uniref:Uncharacterized protein n=1 Tax=Argiope bruennichi TaxID=94029 RepID=A0A8T0FB19_ARGBR|nr:hypothetical protein HNY73_009135 [Argiope bruennichi]